MNHVPYSGPTKVRRCGKKFNGLGDRAPGISALLLVTTYHPLQAYLFFCPSTAPVFSPTARRRP